METWVLQHGAAVARLQDNVLELSGVIGQTAALSPSSPPHVYDNGFVLWAVLS